MPIKTDIFSGLWDENRIRNDDRIRKDGFDLISKYETRWDGTLTGLRISSVDGTAFIDNAGATVPTYADGNHLIEIYDASNRMMKGVLKAAGSGVGTFGDDLFLGWDFTSGWSVTGGSITDANTYVSNPSNGGVYRPDYFLTVGRLYKLVWAGSTTATGTEFHGDINTANRYVNGFGTGYFTILSGLYARAYLRNVGAGTTDISQLELYNQTAPSSSGATIVTTKGGTTYNFTSKNASFTYNSSSYYCVIRLIR